MESSSLNNGKGRPRTQMNQSGISFLQTGITFFSSTIIPIDRIEMIKRYKMNQNCPTEKPPSAPVKSVNFVKKTR